MSAVTAFPATPARRRRSEPRPVSSRPARTSVSPEWGESAAVNPHHRGGRVLFEVPFTSAMGDRELACLARVLDISTHMQPKMRPSPNSPGVVRLDHQSGLFLERGDADDRWLLQARTWGVPSPQTVHEWQLLAAQAARQLDPRVTLPEHLAAAPSAVVDHPVGAAANKRLAPVRRRLAGLP